MSRSSRLAVLLLLPFLAQCRSSGGSLGPTPVPPQTEGDAATTYELLEPATHKFRITHEVTATTPEARTYCAYVRPGIFIEDCHAFDSASGLELAVQLVDARTAHEHGVAEALSGESYLLVSLARPVPAGGQSRVRIAITYLDREAYQFQDDEIGFARTLAAKRVSVVLPDGYALERCNSPVEVETLDDTRVAARLWNASQEAATLKLIGRRKPASPSAEGARAAEAQDASQRQEAGARRPRDDASRVETVPRLLAIQSEHVEVVCVLDAPATNRFRLIVDRTLEYGSQTEFDGAWFAPCESLAARVLDSGAVLQAEIQTRAVTDPPDARVFVTDVPKLMPGQSLRLRLEASVRDPERYAEHGHESWFALSLPAERVSVLLPADRQLSACSPAATIQDLADGRTRLEFVNASGRPLAIRVSSNPR